MKLSSVICIQRANKTIDAETGVQIDELLGCMLILHAAMWHGACWARQSGPDAMRARAGHLLSALGKMLDAESPIRPIPTEFDNEA